MSERLTDADLDALTQLVGRHGGQVSFGAQSRTTIVTALRELQAARQQLAEAGDRERTLVEERDEAIQIIKDFGHVVAGSAGIVSDRITVHKGCDFWYKTALVWLNKHNAYRGVAPSSGSDGQCEAGGEVGP